MANDAKGPGMVCACVVETAVDFQIAKSIEITFYILHMYYLL